jgi:hypothetical protein
LSLSLFSLNDIPLESRGTLLKVLAQNSRMSTVCSLTKLVIGLLIQFVTWMLIAVKLISVLKSLVDNAQMPPDEALSIDLGSLLHVLVGFISRFNDPASYRVRIKFCSLVCSVCERTDALTLRKDDLSRNRILDAIMEWFQDPLLVSSLWMSVGTVFE